MGQYVVDNKHEESNSVADVISMTATVNGTQVAAKVRISALKGKTEQEQKKIKNLALVEAYENRAQDVPETSGELVEA